MSWIREAAATLRPPSGDRHGPLPPIMIALTLVTGIVDATSYLRLGHVFVANMTGNIVFLGFALAGARGVSIVTSLVALAAFLLGAFAGGLLGARNSDHRGRMLRAASSAQATVFAIALVVALQASEPLHSSVRYALLVPMALAMGVQNATAQRLSVPELTTTVLTRTLTGLSSETRIAGGPGSKFGRRAVAVAAMLAGAITGGLLVLHVSVAGALALACAIVAAGAAAIHVLSLRWDGEWARP